MKQRKVINKRKQSKYILYSCLSKDNQSNRHPSPIRHSWLDQESKASRHYRPDRESILCKPIPPLRFGRGRIKVRVNISSSQTTIWDPFCLLYVIPAKAGIQGLYLFCKPYHPNEKSTNTKTALQTCQSVINF